MTLTKFAAALILSTSALPALSLGLAINANLNGNNVIPGPGDSDGSGYVVLALKAAIGEVCGFVSIDGVDQTNIVVRVHKAESGQVGPNLFDLASTSDGSSFACVKHIGPTIINDMKDHPSAYYVNVHNDEFPNGALRGQFGN